MTSPNVPRIITTRNANGALREGLTWLTAAGGFENSRNGPVLVAPGPVLTHYLHPEERVVFSALRDANPFFHLYESVWMLAGRSDSASVAKYARTMDMFANEEGDLAGAYGKRWHSHFGFDQLDSLIELLRTDPKTRRAVLQMWDPVFDLATVGTSKDVPCNTAVYFDGTTGVLNMTVTNRSNDIVWGAYGANSVHMSFLQEYIAHAVGLRVGAYYQFSNNFHTYVDRPDVARLLAGGSDGKVAYTVDDRYSTDPHMKPYALNHGRFDYRRFRDECYALAEHPCDSTVEFHPFFHHVFTPMMRAHREFKYGDYKGALKAIGACQARDWRAAGTEWLQRRETAYHAKKAQHGL